MIYIELGLMSISSLASVHPLAVKTPPAPSSASHHQGVPLDEGWFIFGNWSGKGLDLLLNVAWNWKILVLFKI